MTIVLPVAIISIDDANITNFKTDEEKTLRANQEAGAHNALSIKEDVYKSCSVIKGGADKGGKERNDSEESGCTAS